MRRSAAAILVTTVLALALTTAPAARASSGGTPDPDGRYGNVGLLLNYAGGELGVCSGTLVSPTVVLTAAHCTAGTAGRTLVTFDPLPGLADLPRPADTTAGFEQVGPRGSFNAGTASAHERFSGFTDMKSWNDLGVVVLDEPVNIAPAALGSLDGLAPNKVSKTMFTAVGYGAEMIKPTEGPKKAQMELLPLTRRSVEMAGQKVTPQVLQTQASVDARKGTGATCTGDSGGPVFHGDKLVAVTSFSINGKCTGVAGAQRVDVDGIGELLATVPE